jgi:coenzyme F420-reducing hydrogenase delta subunit
MEAHHILKTLAGGAAGVLVLACEEKACQFLEGSMRSRKRFEYARTWLAELRIDTGRIEFVRISPMDVEALDRTLRVFSANLRRLGNIEAASAP